MCVQTLLKKVQAHGKWEADKDYAGKVKYIIHTKIGRGPMPMPESHSLVCCSRVYAWAVGWGGGGGNDVSVLRMKKYPAIYVW